MSWDPVVVLGTLLSVGLAVFFYFFQALAAAIATFAGMLGLILTLQVQAMIQERQRAYRQGRLGAVISKLESEDWLLEVVEGTLNSATRVTQLYRGTPAATVCREAMEDCRAKLIELEGGRFYHPYADNALALRLCEQLRREFLATSVPTLDLRWWLEPEGRRYWRLQEEALQRGVEIRRVFIHSGWSEELDQLARDQQQAGVDVRRVHQDRLPVGYRGITGIWDGACGQEVVYDSSGQAVLFSYTVSPPELERLRRQFEFVERMAVGLDDPEPTSGVAGSVRGQ